MFEVVYHLSHAPTWLGWTLMTGGLCTVAFLAGCRLR